MLWYEYLKRSTKYEDYCKAKLSPSNSQNPIDPQFKFYDIYNSWGDVFNTSFRVAYKQFLRSQTKQKKEPVQKMGDIFRTMATDLIELVRRKQGREITRDEIVNFFEKLFQEGAIYIKIDLTKGSKEEIVKNIERLLKKRSKEPGVKGIHRLNSANSFSRAKNIRINDLANYLRVYDLKKNGKSNKQIIKQLGTKSDIAALNSKDQNVIRKYKLYHKNAKKIIDNVENGEFPGPY